MYTSYRSVYALWLNNEKNLIFFITERKHFEAKVFCTDIYFIWINLADFNKTTFPSSMRGKIFLPSPLGVIFYVNFEKYC